MTTEMLLTEAAVRHVLLQYCRGIDRMDQALVRSCYHDDAVDTHGSFEGGVDEFLDWVWKLLGKYDGTMHFLGNMLVEVDPTDSRVALAETYGIAHHWSINPDPKRNLVTGFRYVDRFELRGQEEGWRIARRVATTEWVRVDRHEDRWPVPPHLLQGRRDRDDVVYRIRDL